MPNKQHRSISLFTGAGGLDLGLEAAGFSVALCVEKDKDCRKTISLNRNWLLASPGDIHACSPQDFLDQAGLQSGDVALVAGGPPCQPWSKASLWNRGALRGAEDPRAQTIKTYFQFVDAALPRAILLENVRGLASRADGLRLVQDGLERINKERGTSYKLNVLTINAADYGVPQIRERVFMMAHVNGKELRLPEPTHGPNGKEPYLTTWDAIGSLDQYPWPQDLAVRGRWARLLPSIPEGENYLWHTSRGGGEPLFGWRCRYWSFLLKLDKRRPSWTISASPGPSSGPFHWRNRLLSIPELAALQTFPAEYVIFGERISAHRQIGNAVPCAIGELLGLEIRRQFFGEEVRHELHQVPERKTIPIPRRHRIRPVPKELLKLRGKYASHPGVGRGPAPRLRG